MIKLNIKCNVNTNADEICSLDRDSINRLDHSTHSVSIVVLFDKFKEFIKRDSSRVILINLIEVPLNHFLSDFNVKRFESIFHKFSEFFNINQFVFIGTIGFLLTGHWRLAFLIRLWLLIQIFNSLFSSLGEEMIELKM